MKIHKLNATSSTNSYLKKLVVESMPDNFTIVTAEHQTSGKGQLQNKWHSKHGKNLLFSILTRFKTLKINHQAFLNFAVSLAVFEVINTYLPNVKIKWPNDILSRQKKICGILIENSVKNGSINYSIIGIGLNVNQTKFPLNLPNATSLKLVLGKSFNRNKLLHEIRIALQKQLQRIENKSYMEIKTDYESVLYKNHIPTMFKDIHNHKFIGKIIGVSNAGNLQIALENETIKEFAVKEVVFLT